MKWPWYLLLVGVSGCALVNELIHEDDPAGLGEKAARLGPGPEIMAGAIGMREVLSDERALLEDAGSLAPDGGVQSGGGIGDENLDLHRCWLDPKSYEVWVDPLGGGRGWRVVIWPKAWCNAKTYGGGGEFEIDGQSFQILRREIY